MQKGLPQQMTPPTRFARIGIEAKGILRVGWGVFWKTTTAVTTILFVTFVLEHREDFHRFDPRALTGLVVVLGYCATIGAWIGGSAVILTVGWRYWGAWILLPLLGSALAAAILVASGLVLIGQFDSGRPGLHGGGEFAVLLILGFLALLAGIGAVLGGGGGLVLMLIIGTRR